jgi:hypothetical protein
MLEDLFAAKDGKAWNNPGWHDAARRQQKKAQDAGYDPLDGWIWGWWKWE